LIKVSPTILYLTNVNPFILFSLEILIHLFDNKSESSEFGNIPKGWSVGKLDDIIEYVMLKGYLYQVKKENLWIKFILIMVLHPKWIMLKIIFLMEFIY
jgi:hypothetical protein